MTKLIDVECKEFDVSSLSGTAQSFGSALLAPAVKLNFINTSDVDFYVYVAGVKKYRIPSKATLTFDELTERNAENGIAYHWPKGTQLQIVQVTGAGTGTAIAHVITEREL